MTILISLFQAGGENPEGACREARNLYEKLCPQVRKIENNFNNLIKYIFYVLGKPHKGDGCF